MNGQSRINSLFRSLGSALQSQSKRYATSDRKLKVSTDRYHPTDASPQCGPCRPDDRSRAETRHHLCCL